MSTFHRSIRYHRRPLHDVFAILTFLSPFFSDLLGSNGKWQWLIVLAVGFVHSSACLAWSLVCVDEFAGNCSNFISISSHPLC